MNWFRINKAATEWPTTGGYQDWKPILRLEGAGQCVYCAIHEQSFGGERNFHVEHFKPKSKPPFRRLRNAFDNLFYACAICNTFKGSVWPGAVPVNFSRAGFVDPSRFDYCVIFAVDPKTAQLSSETRAGRYMLEQLHLNRMQLILERRVALAQTRLLQEEARLRALLGQWEKDGYPASVSPLIKRSTDALGAVVRLQVGFQRIAPYEPQDVRRGPKRRKRS